MSEVLKPCQIEASSRFAHAHDDHVSPCGGPGSSRNLSSLARHLRPRHVPTTPLSSTTPTAPTPSRPRNAHSSRLDHPPRKMASAILEKAPLPYWALAVSFSLFGVTEWTARLAQGPRRSRPSPSSSSNRPPLPDTLRRILVRRRSRHVLRPYLFTRNPHSRSSRRPLDWSRPLLLLRRLAIRQSIRFSRVGLSPSPSLSTSAPKA